MGMKPIHGDGSEPVDVSIAKNLVNHPNEHPSGKFGAVCKNTVTQPKFMGNDVSSVAKNLVTVSKNVGNDKHS